MREFKWKTKVSNHCIEEGKQIDLNRIKFIEDFEIYNFANNISYKNLLRLGIWSDNYLNGKLDKTVYTENVKFNMNIYGDIGQNEYSKFLDHKVDFKKICNNEIIRVVSPYGCCNKDERDEIYKKNGYEKYAFNLYSNSTYTYIKVISPK